MPTLLDFCIVVSCNGCDGTTNNCVLFFIVAHGGEIMFFFL